MRIISGSRRGLKLNTLEGRNTRPTLDRIKESLFNMLMPYISDAVCCDLFAGSGALCLESLSRGASYAYMFDVNKKAIDIIKKNIEKCRFNDQTTLINYQHLSAIEYLVNRNIKLDIIFLDPPHFSDFAEQALNLIEKNELLSDDGVIIVEHHKDENFDDQYGQLLRFKSKIYGITQIDFYRRDYESNISR